MADVVYPLLTVVRTYTEPQGWPYQYFEVEFTTGVTRLLFRGEPYSKEAGPPSFPIGSQWALTIHQGRALSLYGNMLAVPLRVR